MEERGFFENRRGRKLFFAAHGRRGASWAWLFCNPFLEEKTFSHAVYVNFSRAIAARGGFAFRFDYEGDGDSEGECSSLDLSDWVSDAVSASDFMRAHFGLGASGLFGLRGGAAVACLAAARLECLSLLLWEPVTNGRAHLEDCLRINITNQLATHKRVVEGRPRLLERLAHGETVNVGGYEIGQRMAEELQEFRLTRALGAVGPRCRVETVCIAARSAKAELPVTTGPQRSVTRLEAGQFWHEPRLHDPLQKDLVAASLAFMVGPQPGPPGRRT